jgi:hypothetical protein
MRWIILLVLLLIRSEALAGVRHFGFVYEAPTSAAGSVEMENWISWNRTTNPADADEVAFRHELEIGLTDRFQASVYLADWFYEHSADRSGTVYEDSALELIYNFSNPVIDPVAVSVYQEYKGGYRLFEWESKIILQKNIGRWIFAYNATIEAVWSGIGLAEHEGEISQALGASYEINPRMSIGLEMLHEVVLPGWHTSEHVQNFFVGPNMSYRRGRWFVTSSLLAQATDTADEADFQWRTIFGVGF